MGEKKDGERPSEFLLLFSGLGACASYSCRHKAVALEVLESLEAEAEWTCLLSHLSGGHLSLCARTPLILPLPSALVCMLPQ